MAKNYILDAFTATEEGAKAMKKLMSMYPHLETVTPDSVYKEGNPEARLIGNIVMTPMLWPGSKIINPENLAELYQLAQAGHSCLLLVEHYSNFDLPNFCYLTDNEPLVGPKFADALVALAGVKLSVENEFISAFSRIYNRIVIYPSRTIEKTDKTATEQLKTMKAINMAAMKELTKRKYNKQIFLAFPSGSRIRPWLEETKHGVKEMASYVKAFEYLCFITINGNNLPVNEYSEDMAQDKPQPDIIMLGVDKPMKSADFLASIPKITEKESTDPKAHVVHYVMQKLFKMHEDIEVIRQEALKKHSS